MRRHFLSLVLSFGLLCAQEFKAQETIAYDELAAASWEKADFDKRYHRSSIKGSPLLFEEFLPGKIITPDQRESEPLYLNFDTIGKKLFVRRIGKIRQTNEVKQYLIDQVIIFETWNDDQRILLRQMPEKLVEPKSYPTLYEQLTPANDLLLKETVMAFVQGTKAKSAYSNKEDDDRYVPVLMYYIKNGTGKFKRITLTRKSILSALSPELKTKVLNLAKEQRTKWTREQDVADLLAAVVSN